MMDTKVSIVMYHYVRPIAKSKYPNIKGLELSLFKKQLDFFANNCNVITMEQLIDSIYKKTKLPKNAVLLTFDDGYMDHYSYVYPELISRGFQGSFFVQSMSAEYGKMLITNKIHYILAESNMDDLIPLIYSMLDELRVDGLGLESNEEIMRELGHPNRFDTGETIFVKRLLQNYLPEDIRNTMVDALFEQIVGVDEGEFAKSLYMNMDQMREMKAAGMFFGLHGEKHYWLDKLDKAKLKEDIDNGLHYLDELIDREYLVMNYPYGAYNDQVIEYIKSIGVKLGITVEPGQADIERDSVYTYPRFDTNDFPPKSENYKNYGILL